GGGRAIIAASRIKPAAGSGCFAPAFIARSRRRLGSCTGCSREASFPRFLPPLQWRAAPRGARSGWGVFMQDPHPGELRSPTLPFGEGSMTHYVEFAATSNFSFLWGASHPEELIAQAARLDYFGFGLSDRNSVAGVVRAHLAKRETELALRYHPGARLTFCDGTPDILAYLRDRAGWAKLCRLLTRGNL